jgi:phage terminase large subunit GpA-like protein
MPHGPGAMHWFASMDLDLFHQLLAEKPHTRYVKGRAIREYIKANGARNELLDIAVGNLAMAYYLGLHKWSATDWQRLRDNLVGRASTPDLFAAAAARDYPVAPPEPPAAHLPRPAPVAPPAAAVIPVPPATPAPPPPSGRRVLSKGIVR